MSEVYEVVLGTYSKKENAMRIAAKMQYRGFHRASVRKVNPDAHPVADQE